MSAHTRVSPASFLTLSADVASFYGFKPVKELERSVPAERRKMHTFTTVAHVCTASLASRPGEPIMAFYASSAPLYVPAALASGKLNEVGEFGLQVVGSTESLGEVLLLKTLATIISEWGGTIARLRINATGDKESKMRFTRELGVYLRKHAGELDAACQEKIIHDPFAAYSCSTIACRQILEGGPRAVNFLSEPSRAHFREVLEQIEGLGLPYELDDLLMGDERESHLIFAVDLEGGDATVVAGLGGRYDDYVRRITGRKDSAAVSASILFRKGGLSSTSFSIAPSAKEPKIYFVQLGLRAKLQGLVVLDALRHARLPVLQSFDSSKLGPQLQAAGRAGVSYVLIMGQREALDGTIIIRSTRDSAQDIVALAQLPRFLKTLH